VPSSADCHPLEDTEFAALLTPLGPFGLPPRLGLAVSGGGDSMAMAILAASWAKARSGEAVAFLVDHGLRRDSAAEAGAAAGTLRGLGIRATVLTLTDLGSGPAMPARARAARYRALEAACYAAGVLDLLLAHHAADQAETVLMRALRGSGSVGLAGMAAVTETAGLRLLRPLLTVPPGRLRATLRAHGVPWAEDPSNADERFTRARLRAARADAAGQGVATRALAAAAQADGRSRAAAEAEANAWLAAHVVIRPEGFALLPPGAWPIDALAGLLRMVAGADFSPAPAAVADVAKNPADSVGHGITLGGARLAPGGKLGPGVLLCREAAAMAAPVPADAGAVWDGRFRRPSRRPPLPGEVIGGLGAHAAKLRDWSALPSIVLETLPAYFSARDGSLVAVPDLHWPNPEWTIPRALLFQPARPAAGAVFSAA
jgi:tRNA(Ile)-lysidine synthase